jgi:hypothetical protein
MENQKNLMEINSPNIGKLDCIGEYQTLAINNRVGEFLKNNDAKIKRNKIINIKKTHLSKVWEHLETKFELYQLYDQYVLIFCEDYMAEIWWAFNSSYIGFSMNILSNSIKKCEDAILEIKNSLDQFLIKDNVVEYTIVQHDNGNIKETHYQDTINVDFNSLAIPFVEDVDSYIQSFLNSSSPILILNGLPGTGKSTLTKYIMSKHKDEVLKTDTNYKALYSFDEKIFNSPDFFHQLIYQEYDVVVLEDFNQAIHKNSDEGGINPLHKLLSVTDGVLSKNLKIIITTNIDSINQIHPALTRPGRCFDILKFRNLEGVEIDNLCSSYPNNLDLSTDSISASEFYAKCNGEQNSSIVNNKVGF